MNLTLRDKITLGGIVVAFAVITAGGVLGIPILFAIGLPPFVILPAFFAMNKIFDSAK